VVQEALACGLPVLTSDAPAYAPYRGTPGLHLCAADAATVRGELRRLLQLGGARVPAGSGGAAIVEGGANAKIDVGAEVEIGGAANTVVDGAAGAPGDVRATTAATGDADARVGLDPRARGDAGGNAPGARGASAAPRIAAGAAGGGLDCWLRALFAPALVGAARRPGLVVLAFVLVAAHLVLVAARLPGRVWARRVDDVAAYRERGAPHFLLEGAKRDGAADLAWLLRAAPPDSVVLWRWPADGALEFVAALLAPRLLVDERAVPPDATAHAGRPLAQGTLPDGTHGVLVVQGTAAEGLVLTTRGR
jgi:hypothetical protein